MQATQNLPKLPFPRSLLYRWQTKLRESLIYKTSVKGQHGPIKIVSLSLQENSEEFVTLVEKALLLLGNVHPRGYRRVRRELTYIADSSLLSMGRYDVSLRACMIDFARLGRYASNQTEEWTVAYLACVILHEATHGHMYSRGIQYDEKTRARIERLCVREEERFAARLTHRKFTARLVPAFDEARWQESWSRTRKQRAKELFSRLRQDIREMRKRPPKSAPKSIFSPGESAVNLPSETASLARYSFGSTKI